MGDFQRGWLFCQDRACCQVLDIARVVIPAVRTFQIGKVQIAVLPHHHPLTKLDMTQP